MPVPDPGGVRRLRPRVLGAGARHFDRRAAGDLDAIIAWRGRPATIVSDNGTERTSNAILEWADERQQAEDSIFRRSKEW
jgi:hypothetical protein